jgi:hypothetical protein
MIKRKKEEHHKSLDHRQKKNKQDQTKQSVYLSSKVRVPHLKLVKSSKRGKLQVSGLSCEEREGHRIYQP